MISNTWRNFTLVSPMNFVTILSIKIRHKGKCSSPAKTEAVMVFPVPGGPTSNIFRRLAIPYFFSLSRCRYSFIILSTLDLISSVTTSSDKRLTLILVWTNSLSSLFRGTTLFDLAPALSIIVRISLANFVCPCLASYAASCSAKVRKRSSFRSKWDCINDLIWSAVAIAEASFQS